MSACPFAQRALGQAFVRPGGKNSILAPAEFWTPPALTGPSTLDAAGYQSLIKDIQSACDAGSLSPPTLCRLGFHSVHIAASVGKGRGANGGFHAWPVDYAHPGNAGLGDDIKYLLQLRANYPGITHADLFSLAGSLGPELAGGPPIAWYPGRLDSTGPGPSDPALSAALPDGNLNAAGVQTSFETILGLTVREQVIFLGGGHSFGGATLDGSGWNGSFTGSDSWPKYVLKADAGSEPTEDTIFRLPADYALKQADVYRKWAEVYAQDEDAFTRDFQRVYQRAMQVGAGHTHQLMPEVFTWQGLAGKFEGFGTNITPLDDDEAVTS